MLVSLYSIMSILLSCRALHVSNIGLNLIFKKSFLVKIKLKPTKPQNIYVDVIGEIRLINSKCTGSLFIVRDEMNSQH